MKINTIVNRYIFTELFPPFIISVIFFNFIFFMREILDITNMVINYKVDLSTFILFLVYGMPYFLVFIIPMATMMSVLLTFLKLSGDNEITALKAGGISLFRLLTPVMGFCLLGMLLTAGMTFYGMPWGNSSARALGMKVVSANLDVGLKARQFNDSFDGIMLYVNQIDQKDRIMRHVFIEDNRLEGKSSTIVATKGHLVADAKQPLKYYLKLYGGVINQVQLEKAAANTLSFDTYELSLDLKKMMPKKKTGPKDEKEMFFNEMIAYLKTCHPKAPHRKEVILELHKKFSIPFACIALGVLGMPLGIQSRSSKKSFGLGLGLLFFVLYYILLSAGMLLGESGHCPPLIGMWLPNIIFGSLGFYLLVRVSKDDPVQIHFFDHFIELISKFFKRFAIRSKDL